MRNLLCIFLFSIIAIVSGNSQNGTFSDFQIDTFDFKGYDGLIVIPHEANEGRNWVWRARFWGHEPQTDLALLDLGFHVAYVDVSGLFGNQEAIERWNKFYAFITEKYDLNPKVAIEAFSRGGLIAYNWAAENTEKVACIYADAPVCDIKSWPGGKFNGNGSPQAWEKCLTVLNLDEDSVSKYEGIPLFTCIKVAEADIPVLHICGGADKVVPYEENTALLAENFRKAGGKIEIILKEGVGHHPHSLEDPKLIVDFILGNSANHK